MLKKHLIAISSLVLATTILICGSLVVEHKQKLKRFKTLQPIYYTADGKETTEQPEDYEIGAPFPIEVIETLVTEQVDMSDTAQLYTTDTYQYSPRADLLSLINLDETNAWRLVTAGEIDSYPRQSYAAYRPMVSRLHQNSCTQITVDVWYWANPSDDTNFEKVTKQYSCNVNSAVAPLFEAAFNDIYQHPSKPVINLADRGMGTWADRSKTSSSGISAHALGVAIDINPSTGSYNINGTSYGNAYRNKAMPTSIWQTLPETHKKYHVLYEDSPIVHIFKSYGFCWGGDWKSGTDCMHFSYIGDGANARQIGQANYKEETLGN